MKLKFQLILRPLFFTALSIILGYALIVWLIFIPNQLFDLKEELLFVYIPMALPWIPLYLLMGPRFKLLKPRTPRQNINFGLTLLSGLTILIATLISQEYLHRATGKMLHLQTISEFEQKGSPQYCTIQNSYIWKKKYGIHRRSQVGSKGSRLTFYIYLTLPIFEKAADTVREDCSYWLAISYDHQISNRLSGTEKAKEYLRFNEDALRRLRETNFNQFEYLELQGNNKLKEQCDNAIRQSDIVRYKAPIFFKASKEPFEKRFGHLLLGFFITLLIGGLIIVVGIFFSQLKTENEDEALSDKEL